MKDKNGNLKVTPFYGRLRALLDGKKVFIIPDFNAIVLASSRKQCESKFTKHEVVECPLFHKVKFIIFGINYHHQYWKQTINVAD